MSSNLPPGVTVSDLPGWRPGDGDDEYLQEVLAPKVAADMAAEIVSDLFGSDESLVETLCQLSDLAATIKYDYENYTAWSGTTVGVVFGRDWEESIEGRIEAEAERRLDEMRY